MCPGMRTFKRSWGRRITRAYWRVRACLWRYNARDAYGFNPWRLRIARDEVAHGEVYSWAEVKAHLRLTIDSRGENTP